MRIPGMIVEVVCNQGSDGKGGVASTDLARYEFTLDRRSTDIPKGMDLNVNDFLHKGTLVTYQGKEGVTSLVYDPHGGPFDNQKSLALAGEKRHPRSLGANAPPPSSSTAGNLAPVVLAGVFGATAVGLILMSARRKSI
jgi:hypothetical protein